MLSDKQILTIEALLARGKRVELTPTKDGVIIATIQREKVKN